MSSDTIEVEFLGKTHQAPVAPQRDPIRVRFLGQDVEFVHAREIENCIASHLELPDGRWFGLFDRAWAIPEARWDAAPDVDTNGLGRTAQEAVEQLEIAMGWTR